METKKKTNIKKEVISEENVALKKEGYPIKLISNNFIIIDKHGINKNIKLSREEIIGLKIGDLYYE